MTILPNRPKQLSFKKARVIEPLYTSGSVAVTLDGTRIFTTVAEDILLTDIAQRTEICRFAGDTQKITSFCISATSAHLLVFTTSLALRVYEVPTFLNPSSKSIQPIRVVARSHDAPIHVCKADPSSHYLASGSADGVVKVWDIVRGYVTHVFKGHGGVVSALVFNYPQDVSSVSQDRKMQLITASVDTRIRIYDLMTKSTDGAKPEVVLEGHVSVPCGLDVTMDGKWLISGGRDSVVLIWDISSISSHIFGKTKGKAKVSTPILAKTVPTFEQVEAVGLLHPDEDVVGHQSSTNRIRFYTGGEHGIVKIWDGQEGKVITTLGESHSKTPNDAEESRQVVDILYVPSKSTIVSVHADQNILFHSLSTGTLLCQMIGYNDQIVDATFLSPRCQEPSQLNVSDVEVESHLALATNSSLIRIYDNSSLDARLLSGHKDIVLCLDHGVGGRILASGSKDRTARIWAPTKSNNWSNGWGYGCVAICEGHAESIGAIAMSRKENDDMEDLRPRFMFTGSQDRTIKMWDLTGVPTTHEAEGKTQESLFKCKSLSTHKAHDKDINSLDVAPTDLFLASGSQDRTAKVFEIRYILGNANRATRGEIKLVGTCKGHKRGVWSVRFSRAERVLATGSGDKTVRLWSLEDFSCLKTFEGHTNSVLRVDFINMGMQLVSAASDGLVKLWSVREEECTATMDNHTDKVWALAVSSDEHAILSGAADSIVTFWKDCTEEQEREKEEQRASMISKEQDFLNYLSLHNYQKAIQLALSMDQPGRLFNLFKDVQSSQSLTDVDSGQTSIVGSPSVDEVIRQLNGADLVKLLRHVRAWNANAKTSEVAQNILHAVIKLQPVESIVRAFKEQSCVSDLVAEADSRSGGMITLKEFLEGLIPYTERHLSRIDRLLQDSYMVNYILGEMANGMLDSELDDVDVHIHSQTPA